MSNVSHVVIIYNPNSTGDGKSNAQSLQQELVKVLPGSVKVALKKTDYAGHAEKIAASYARKETPTLVVSSSGDGGYNEVINGALSVSGSRVATSVLPSGNANDHHRAVAGANLVQDIAAGNFRMIDVIRVSASVGGKPWTRYAHSYIGIGLSPAIGRQLTEAKLNIFNEKWLLLKFFFAFTHISILVDNHKVRYSSLVFSNVDTMSKVIKLSDNASLRDGKFEINAIKHQNKLKLGLYLIQAATKGLSEQSSQKSFTFTTIRPTAVQLDGEVFTLDGHTDVIIESSKRALRCIV